jgi:hypothetical protein
MNNIFNELVAALSNAVGVELETAEDTRVLASFDDLPVLIEYLPDDEQILIAAPVGKVPGNGREAFLQRLLQGQYLFHQTGGATLALDMAGEAVSLQLVKDIQTLTPVSFLTLMENFLRVAGHWGAICEEADTAPAASGEAEASVSPSALRI